MKFFNLMNVADTRISMMLTGIDPTNKKIGFDFTTNKWLDNNLYTPNRIITVRKFRGTWIYKKLASNALVNFSTFKIKNIKALSDIETYRGTLLVVEVHLSYQKFPFLKQTTKKLTKEAHAENKISSNIHSEGNSATISNKIYEKGDSATEMKGIADMRGKDIPYVPYTGKKSLLCRILNEVADLRKANITKKFKKDNNNEAL